MNDDYASGGSRNKKKDKLKEKKKNPYKTGGRFRTINIKLINSFGNAINIKKKNSKKKDKISKNKNKYSK